MAAALGKPSCVLVPEGSSSSHGVIFELFRDPFAISAWETGADVGVACGSAPQL